MRSATNNMPLWDGNPQEESPACHSERLCKHHAFNPSGLRAGRVMGGGDLLEQTLARTATRENDGEREA